MTLLLAAALTVTMTQGLPAQAPAALPSAGVDRQPDAANGSPESRDLPISLARIQRKLSRPAAIRLQGNGLVFRVEVLGRKPTIEDILGPDYLKGPVPAGAMSHQEFLDIVTPKDVQGYAAFNNREGLIVAATSFALKWALQRAIHKYETAKHEREREAARKEVQDALAELERARRKAGLPPK